MALRDVLFGSPERQVNLDRLTPDQQQASSQVLQQALSGLQDTDRTSFEPIAQQARQQFQEETVPSIAERFSQFNGQRSGAFQQALGQSGAQLESSLAGQQAQFNQQNMQQLMQLLNQGLQPQFEAGIQQGSPGALPALGGVAGETLGSMIPGYIPQLLSLLQNSGGGGQSSTTSSPRQSPVPKNTSTIPRISSQQLSGGAGGSINAGGLGNVNSLLNF